LLKIVTLCSRNYCFHPSVLSLPALSIPNDCLTLHSGHKTCDFHGVCNIASALMSEFNAMYTNPYPANATLLRRSSARRYLARSALQAFGVKPAIGKTIILKMLPGDRQCWCLSRWLGGPSLSTASTTIELWPIKFIESDSFLLPSKRQPRRAPRAASMLAREVRPRRRCDELCLPEFEDGEARPLTLSWVSTTPERNFASPRNSHHKMLKNELDRHRTVTRYLRDM